jgi:hypothetical protein
VWFDDRVDLHDVRLTEDYLRVLHGEPGALAIVEAADPDVVLWRTGSGRGLDAQLAASGRWRRVGVRDGWAVWIRGS